ncbi:unnamed protein product, partial [Ectocarpus sp. 8 AP-2014]
RGEGCCGWRARRLVDRRSAGEGHGAAIGSKSLSGSTRTGNARTPLLSAFGYACLWHIRFYRHGYMSNAGKRFRSAANQTDGEIHPTFGTKPGERLYFFYIFQHGGSPLSSENDMC